MKTQKGLTLIEVIVIIAIIFMLWAILMPQIGMDPKIARRVVCGTSLKMLGNAMTVYANDFDGQYPYQGMGAGHTWADWTDGWDDPEKDWSKEDNITVGASLYLLVRLADVSPKSFVCPASDQEEFTGKNAKNLDIVEIWDFGQSEPDPRGRWEAEGPARCVSYSYHQPYDPAGEKTGSPGRFRADDTRSAAFAVMADRNPWYDPKLPEAGMTFDPKHLEDWVSPILDHWNRPPTDSRKGTIREKIMIANAQPHQRDGQNVVFADGHNSFEKMSDVGIKNDNIYTRIDMNNPDPMGRRRGLWTEHPDRSGENETPATKEDSFLVNDFIEKVR